MHMGQLSVTEGRGQGSETHFQKIVELFNCLCFVLQLPANPRFCCGSQFDSFVQESNCLEYSSNDNNMRLLHHACCPSVW